MKQKIIAQGAEAIISLENNTIKKTRVTKSYRHPLLDKKLRTLRTRSEAKIMQKLSSVILVPKIIKTDEQNKEIIMEYIEGKKLSDVLEKAAYKNIAKKIGEIITRMHNQDIIHGDLTTSNMILKNEEIYLVDFGLAFHSKKREDKAVDLHLLKQALDAKHFTIAEKCFSIILKHYTSHGSKEILEQFKKVESRGRYKERY